MRILINLLLFVFTLTFFVGCKDEVNPVTPPEEHFEPEGWLIRDATLRPVLVVFQGFVQNTWNGNPVDTILYAPLNALSKHYSVRFVNAQKEIINQPSSAYSLGFAITDTSILTTVKDSPTDWAFHLKGKKIGSTSLELRVLHGSHADVITPKIRVMIKEDSTAFGEAIAVRLKYEETDSLIAFASQDSIHGSLILPNGSTTEHISVDFMDSNNNYFQPEYPLHSLKVTIVNANLGEVIYTEGEPWVFQVKGKNTGQTTIRITITVGGVDEYIFPDIPLLIQ